MSDLIHLSGLDRADVLAALYNNAQPQGLGWLHYDPKPMTIDVAEDLLANSVNFDYVFGRVMKVRLGDEWLDPRWYDRDNGGEGTAAAIIDGLRA